MISRPSTRSKQTEPIHNQPHRTYHHDSMKTKPTITLATFVALAALVFASAPAQAAPEATTPITLDSENAARVFLGNEISYFSGGFGDWLKPVNQNTEGAWEYGEFTMLPNGNIKALSLNGVPVAIDPNKPLLGLPYPRSGTRTQFYFYVNGYDKNGTFVASGYFEAKTLKKGDPIIVKLEAATVPSFVRFSLPAGINANNLILEDTAGSWWNYDVRAGGFNIYYDPIRGTGFRILDQSTGIVYGVGHIPPFQASTVSSNDSVITLQYEGNVVDLPFSPTRGYIYRQAQKLDGAVANAQGNAIPAKVYMARLGGNALNVYVNSIHGKIIIKQWVAEGDLPVIAESDTVQDPRDTSSSGGASIPPGYDKVIIEITGNLENPNGFDASISSFAPGNQPRG